jgi:tol-pal system protein YbgF
VQYKKCFIYTFLLLSFCFIPILSNAGNPAPVTEPASEDVLKRLDKLERLLQSQGLLDMLQQLDALQTELNQLRGEIEVQNHTLDQIKKRQRDIYADMDRRLQRLETGNNISSTISDSTPPLEVMPPAEETASVTENKTTPGLTFEQVKTPAQTSEEPIGEATTENLAPTKTMPDPVVDADPATIQAEYQQAFKLLKQSQYDQAIEKFGVFLSRYPESEYSDNAQYWRGEAYYVTRRYEEAIKEYNKLVGLYPKSQKVTHSLLKMGYSHQELNITPEQLLPDSQMIDCGK